MTDQSTYVEKVLNLYLGLPQTPTHGSGDDQLVAHDLFRRQVSLEIIEAAFLLGSARRLFRDTALPPLQPIRSLRYFLPIIAEVSDSPLSSDYLRYLRRKLAPLMD